MTCSKCNSTCVGYEPKNETENVIICFTCGHAKTDSKNQQD
ncbi:hypothetical protein bcere0022_30230 [Bacillus cereus Rock3-44]|nr:hypothetical protein bcere0022_30230 [Bacillus cereus Rock3-44]